MPSNAPSVWTDDKVDETVTSRFVHSHLRPDEAERLTNRVFGELSDQTYLEWVLTRAKRFFLILVDTGVPDQIFGIIDDSYDDQDLPIPEDAVADLRLSFNPNKSLDRRFYRTQFKYLTRVVCDGEHIRYAREEAVPIQVLGMKPVVNRELSDKVKLPSQPKRVFVRRRFSLDETTSEIGILSEIAAFKSLSHEHVLSIFGSYTQDHDLYVLLSPATEYTLKNFLNDLPKPFEALSKTQRRQTLLLWPHCIANALAWLHINGSYHGCVRPSRVHVDDAFRICLGFFDGDWVLGMPSPKDDIEAYQYAAPERWKRAVTVQSNAMHAVSLPSGGRSARRGGQGPEEPIVRNGGHMQHPSIDISGPTSYAFMPTSKGNLSRLRLGTAIDPTARQLMTRRLNDSRLSNRTDDSQGTIRAHQNRLRNPEGVSVQSSSSSGSGRNHRESSTNPIYASTPEMRTTVVQTWKSVAHDLPAADIFSASAVIMDILTVLCKRNTSAFAKHRSSRNRQAGRGGGLADASFHANIGQIATWAQGLCKDVEKKIKKEEGQMLNAVGPMLQVVLQCLDREPTRRMTAEQLSQKLEEHLSDFAGLNATHCGLQVPDELSQPSASERPPGRTSSRMALNYKQKEPVRNREDQHTNRPRNTSKSKPTRREFVESSSMESFHYGYDPDSEPVRAARLEEEISENEYNRRLEYRKRAKKQRAQRAQPQKSESSRRTSYLHEDELDSDVDPTFSPSTASTPGTFAYTNTSNSALSNTSDEHSSSSFTTYTTPLSNPPSRKLPAPPPLPPPELARRYKESHSRSSGRSKGSSKGSSKAQSLKNVEHATQQLSQTIQTTKSRRIKQDDDDDDDYYEDAAELYQNYSHPHAYGRRQGKDYPNETNSPNRLPHRSRGM